MFILGVSYIVENSVETKLLHVHDLVTYRWLVDLSAVIVERDANYWSVEVNAAFIRLEEGHDRALRGCYRKQVSHSSALRQLQETGNLRQHWNN